MLDQATERVRANRRIEASAAVVRAIVLDQPGHARWFPGLKSVERVPAPRADAQTWRWSFQRAAIQIEVRDLEHAPYGQIEWRYAGTGPRRVTLLRFEFMRESGDACTVSIEEHRHAPGLWARLAETARPASRLDGHRYLEAFVRAFGSVPPG